MPAHCEGGSIDHFFENGDELNEQMVQRLEAAREMGLVLDVYKRQLCYFIAQHKSTLITGGTDQRQNDNQSPLPQEEV